MRKRILLFAICAVLFFGIGSAPRYLEELCIGGGYGDSVDGGADFASDGTIFTDGNATGGVFTARHEGPEYRFEDTNGTSGTKVAGMKYVSGDDDDSSEWQFVARTDSGAWSATVLKVDREGNVYGMGSLDLGAHLCLGSLDGTAAAGMIQWTGSAFSGYSGSSWNTFTLLGPDIDLGTEVTGVLAGSQLDIDGTTAFSGQPDADADKLLISDGGTNKSITVQQILKVWQPFELTPGGALLDASNPPERVEWSADPTRRHVLKFAGDTANERCQWSWHLPANYVGGTAVKVRVSWTCQSGGASGDNVRFHVRAFAAGDGDALDGSFGTSANLDDVWVADGDAQMTAEATLTIGGTPAAADNVVFELERDYDYAGGGQALDVDASVIGLLGNYQAQLETVE